MVPPMSPVAPWSRRNRDLERRLEGAERALEKAKRGAWKDENLETLPLDYTGAEIVIQAASKPSRKRKKAQQKEPFTVESIESLPAGDVLYDIGANVGAYSLIAAPPPAGSAPCCLLRAGLRKLRRDVHQHRHQPRERADHAAPSDARRPDARATFRYSDVRAGAARHAGGVAVPVGQFSSSRFWPIGSPIPWRRSACPSRTT
jgi:hypothetical protein